MVSLWVAILPGLDLKPVYPKCMYASALGRPRCQGRSVEGEVELAFRFHLKFRSLPESDRPRLLGITRDMQGLGTRPCFQLLTPEMKRWVKQDLAGARCGEISDPATRQQRPPPPGKVPTRGRFGRGSLESGPSFAPEPLGHRESTL